MAKATMNAIKLHLTQKPPGALVKGSRVRGRHALLAPARGNGGQKVIFSASDYAAYRDRLAEAAREAGVAVWAWQLMPNHVHLILAPGGENGLRHALARVHRSYAGMVHARRKRTGHFWQAQFGAVAMDEPHLAAAFRGVTLNPARARLVRHAEDWPWSSARATWASAMTPSRMSPRLVSDFPASPTCWKATKILPGPRDCAREKAWGAPSARKVF